MQRIDIRLRADDPKLHDLGGLSVAAIVVSQGDKEARFYVRVRIPDDPRGGVEGSPYVEVSTPDKSRDRSKEIRGVFRDFS